MREILTGAPSGGQKALRRAKEKGRGWRSEFRDGHSYSAVRSILSGELGKVSSQKRVSPPSLWCHIEYYSIEFYLLILFALHHVEVHWYISTVAMTRINSFEVSNT